MEKIKRLILLTLLAVFSFSCGGGSRGANDDLNNRNDDDLITDGKFKIAGFVQKGPFVQGSEIKIAEIDEELVPIGTSFTTSTVDDFGSFEISREMSTKYVEVTASGFYFNEVEGTLSTAGINFRVVADLSEEKPVNINILTTIERERIKTLINDGKSFEEARSQAEAEILEVFNIRGFETANFQEMDISKEGDSNAILLAISAVLQQGNTEAQLSELISKITQELRNNGKVVSQGIKDTIRENGMALDLVAVRTNLEKRYADLGLEITIPRFEDFVDSDGDGIINRYDFTIEFETVENGDLNTEYTSNEVEIVLPPEAESAEASVDKGSVVVNGEDKEISATVKNGDKVAVKLLSSDKHGEAVTTELSVKYLEIQEVKGSFTVTAKTGKYFSLDFEPVTDGDLDTEYTSNEIEITLPAGVPETQLSVDKGSIIINGTDKGVTATAVNGDKIAIKTKSSKTEYRVTDTVAVTGVYLEKNEVKGAFSVTVPSVKCGDEVCVDRLYELEWAKELSGINTLQNGVNYCENLVLESKNDWRVPNINELRALVINCPEVEFGGECHVSDPGSLGFGEGICNCVDNGTQYSPIGNEINNDNYWGLIWSTSPSHGSSDHVWIMNYRDGGLGNVEKNTDDTSVQTRCVRGKVLFKEGKEPESQIYQDPDTNLEWTKYEVNNTFGEFFENYCQDLWLEGKGGWRVPTISELRTLIKNDSVLKIGGTCHITDECVEDDSCGASPSCISQDGGTGCLFDTNIFTTQDLLPATLSSSVLKNSGDRLVISFCKPPKQIQSVSPVNTQGMIRCVRN